MAKQKNYEEPAVFTGDAVEESAVTDDVPVSTENGLDIQPVEWVGGRGGQPKLPHPQIVAMLKTSWDNRVEKGNKLESPAFRIRCMNADDVKLRTRQIREAADHLNIGAGVRTFDMGDGTSEVHFRAKRRRGSGGTVAATEPTGAVPA